MDKKYIIPAIIFFAIINLYAACGGGEDDGPAYFFKCKVNGVYKDYGVNYAYYDAENDITVVKASSGLHGEVEMVWKGQKIASGEIAVEGMDGADNPHLWMTDAVGSLDTFKTLSYKYKLSKYGEAEGKIVGAFSAQIKANKIAYMLDTIMLDTISQTDTLIIDTVETQIVMFKEVPEFIIDVSDGKFSLYRGE